MSRRRKPTPEEEAEMDEMSYEMIADELNDGTPGQVELEDLDQDMLEEAERHARRHDLNWPPQTGDFDRWLERKAYSL